MKKILFFPLRVSGQDVYVAGTEYSGSHDIAKYWNEPSIDNEAPKDDLPF